MEVRARSGSGEPCRREPRRPGSAILTKLHGSNFSFHELPFSLYKHPSISARGGPERACGLPYVCSGLNPKNVLVMEHLVVIIFSGDDIHPPQSPDFQFSLKH